MRKPLVALALAVALLAGAAHARTFDSAVAYESWVILHNLEQRHQIPRGLLMSMSLVETGHGLEGAMLPWPYTVNVNRKVYHGKGGALSENLNKLIRAGYQSFDVNLGGESLKKVSAAKAKVLVDKKSFAELEGRLEGYGFNKRFHSKLEAVSYANRLLRNGQRNFDVGLMQVNWYYHGKNFQNLEEAFDPHINAQYAVNYLKTHRENRDWWHSVGRYHSGTSKFAERYIRNVWAMYQRVHRIPNA